MSKHRLHRFKISITQIIILSTFYSLLSTLIGCEAFVRKFTRKPKKELPKEEMVLVPEEYKGPQMSKEDLYRQYFLFWKSWQDELITSLSPGANQKKQIDCVEEAIKNLINLKVLLNENTQRELDVYISQLNDLEGLISKDTYGANIINHRQNAERIKRNILRDFSYKKIKKDL